MQSQNNGDVTNDAVSLATKCIFIEHGVDTAEEKQPIHWFLGGKGLGIQQGTSVWFGSPKYHMTIIYACWGEMTRTLVP